MNYKSMGLFSKIFVFLLLISLTNAGFLIQNAHAQGENLTGAIWTTIENGTTVNGNIYAAKRDVYINGGPQNIKAQGLPDGNYYFQVTTPPGGGSITLLSTDILRCRQVKVVAGKVNGAIPAVDRRGNPCQHKNGIFNPANNSLPVQLVPYNDTTNPGGVYKVYLTKVGDLAAGCDPGTTGSRCGGDVFGFIHSQSKTDNFRLRERATELRAFKWYDSNADGILNAGDLQLNGWPMMVGPNTGSSPTTQGSTAIWKGLTLGTYSVTEATPTGSWLQSGSAVNGIPTVPNPVNPVSAKVERSKVTRVDFLNYCAVPSNGRTLGFWSNQNGEATMNDGGTLLPELELLSSYNLRDALGNHFNPTTYEQFRTWLLIGNARNMSYMLSVQLAAMVLNVESGLVDRNAFYKAYGTSINDLLVTANTALCPGSILCDTTEASALRTLQEEAKNRLDELNNGAFVVPATPCDYIKIP